MANNQAHGGFSIAIPSPITVTNDTTVAAGSDRLAVSHIGPSALRPIRNGAEVTVSKKKRKQRSAKKKKPARRQAAARDANRPAETRAADAMTVGWMLSTVATLFGAIAGGGLWLVLSLQGEPLGQEVLALPMVLLFAAQVSGLVAMLLTPVVHYVRVEKPPKLITCAVLLIAVAPWVMAMTLSSPQA